VGTVKFGLDVLDTGLNLLGSTGVFGKKVKESSVAELDKTFEMGSRAAEALGKKETYVNAAGAAAATLSEAAKGNPSALSNVVSNLDLRNAGKKAAINVANKAETLTADGVRAIEQGTQAASTKTPAAPPATARHEGVMTGEPGKMGVGVQDTLATKGAAPVLDPLTSPIHSIKEARRLDGENRGAIFVSETVPKADSSRFNEARSFEAGTEGAFSQIGTEKRVVPALRFDNPNENPRANNFVRFDGYEDAGLTLIDRKTQLTTGSKQLADIRRASEALSQNADLGYRLIYEFPTQGAMESAQRILGAQGIHNIGVRVTPK
jgi:hypothetical protein